MINNILSSYQTYIFRKCESITNKKYWVEAFALSLPFVVLFFAFPAYDGIATEFSELWNAVLRQVDNPFQEHGYDPYSHEAKTSFRLTVPLIAKFLHLNIFGILLLQGICGMFLFYMTAKIFLSITEDKTTSLLLTLALAFTWSGRANFSEVRAMFDGVSIFFLVSSVFFRNPILIFAGILLSSFTDERGLIASSMVFLYWSYYPEKKINFINKQTISIVFSWITYFALRFYLTTELNLTTHSGYVGFWVLREQINNLPIGLWSALEGFWILVVLSILILLKQKKYVFISLYLSALLIVLVVAMCVHDITRSMAYAFPIVFTSIIILKELEIKENLKKIALAVASLSFIYPAYDTTGDYFINWIYPLPLQILRMMFGTGIIFGNG